ncbi:MAG: succinate dehydrogenase iron-sulfur subunit [Candidatus Coatesbacteria bacterium]|nr:MAG: succinate dehydrogenase iron-sulfur subunit [Candidatus Coatesbacteria bacterium]
MAPAVEFRVTRYDPAADEQPRLVSYEVEVAAADRVLDGLEYIKRRLDPSVAFRRSCAHGVCGSDALVINGTVRLACKTLLQDLEPPLLVEPLATFPVIRDLVVDLTSFFEATRRVRPWLEAGEPIPEREFLQTPAELTAFAEGTKCILCASCVTACPVVKRGTPYIGPAAVVQGHRFVNDSRDVGAEARLRILAAADGAGACENFFECTKVCPRGILVTKRINEIKAMLQAGGYVKGDAADG